MCDTMIAPPDVTSDHTMLFGKNSDRQRNEAQTVEYCQGADHAQDAKLACTHITIAQAQRTHAVLLCRPFWIWGAEMGANEHGVAIGNEGVQARTPAAQEEALTGMDLLRLALERAATASQATEVIVDLLTKHGQGGNCGHLEPAFYNNSFLIADPTEAFVMETIGREWLVERVRGVRAISNGYSIGSNAERVSPGLNALVRTYGWNGEDKPVYAELIADPKTQHIGQSAARRSRATSLLASSSGQLTVGSMMRILRDHGSDDPCSSRWHPQNEPKRTLCLHALSEQYPAQTTGSLISELHKEHPIHWVTGTAAPCTSIFKPVLLGVPLPFAGPRPTDRFDPKSLWWRHEWLHRAALMGDFAKFLDDIQDERAALEERFRVGVNAVLCGGSPADRTEMIVRCWKEAAETEERWLKRIEAAHSESHPPYRSSWERMMRVAGMSPEQYDA
jgi:secernin